MQKIDVNKDQWDKAEQEVGKINFPMRIFKFLDCLKKYPYPLTLNGFEILLLVEQNPGISIQELAKLKSVAQSTMSRNIKKLTMTESEKEYLAEIGIAAEESGEEKKTFQGVDENFLKLMKSPTTGKFGCYLTSSGRSLFVKMEYYLGRGIGSVDRKNAEIDLKESLLAQHRFDPISELEMTVKIEEVLSDYNLLEMNAPYERYSYNPDK